MQMFLDILTKVMLVINHIQDWSRVLLLQLSEEGEPSFLRHHPSEHASRVRDQ